MGVSWDISLSVNNLDTRLRCLFGITPRSLYSRGRPLVSREQEQRRWGTPALETRTFLATVENRTRFCLSPTHSQFPVSINPRRLCRSVAVNRRLYISRLINTEHFLGWQLTDENQSALIKACPSATLATTVQGSNSLFHSYNPALCHSLQETFCTRFSSLRIFTRLEVLTVNNFIALRAGVHASTKRCRSRRLYQRYLYFM